MPFPFISAALGICFLLVWAFIGAMILRNAQLAVRRELDPPENTLAIASAKRARRRTPRPPQILPHRRAPVRAAS
jgi:hypothetical protein